MAKHPIGHRSGEFSQIIAETNDNLKWLFQTKNPVMTLAASGTGTIEAAIINFLSAGDRVIVGSNGKFGERWAANRESLWPKRADHQRRMGRTAQPRLH